MTQTPAGWHPDPSNGGQLRYWDGQQWTEHFAPSQTTATPQAPIPTQAPHKKKHTGRNVLLGIVGVIVVIAIFSSLGGGSGNSDGATPTADTSTSTDASTPAKKAPSKPKAPKYTMAQQSAMRTAQQYLDLGSGFSHNSLIRQMTVGNGFSRADAAFAVDHMSIDYKKQAVLAAKAYMDISGFSRSSLIQQLKVGNLFNQQQAEYACDQIGLN